MSADHPVAQRETTSPMFETIEVETLGRVGVVRLNRPSAMNALNSELMAEVRAATAAFDADPGVGAIVVTGSERAFAAGADIREMSDQTYASAYLTGLFAGWRAFAELRTPTVAAVSGWALGGGCELAMMCDIVIAADTAVFGQPEVQLGVIPGLGGTQRLTRAVGKSKAMEMLLTGRTITAAEAEQAGLVSRVVPASELMSDALRTADQIAAHSLPVIYAIKQAVLAAFESSLNEGLRFERQTFLGMFSLADQKEGMTAFLEKRPPLFRNE